MAKRGVGRRKRYSPTDIDKALAVLASTGSSLEASELTDIPASTLRDWKVEHQERYAAIQEREAPRLEAIAASQAREIIIRAGETEHTLLDRLNARLADDETSSKELSELAGTLQRVTTAKGINGTKLLELTGRPTQIVEHRDPRQEGLALLRRFGITVNSTATDLPDSRALPLTAESVSANVRGAEPNPAASTPTD